MLFIQPTVLPREQCSQGERQNGREEHERGANRLAPDVARAVGFGVDIGAEEGATLADEVEDDDAHSSTGVGALVV